MNTNENQKIPTDPEPNEVPEKKSKKKSTLIIIMSAIVLVAAGVFLGIWLANREQQTEGIGETDIPLGGRGTVAVDGTDLITPLSDELASAAQYTVKMTNDWVFDTATSPSQNVFVENTTRNSHTVYFDLILPETDEVLYSSPYMPVGAKIESITLDVLLPAGEYEPIVIYHLVDNDGNVLSTVSVRIFLRVLG